MNEDMYDVAVMDPFEPTARPVTVVPIANGYLVQSYGRTGQYEQWYCIDFQEIAEKLQKFL